MYDFVNILLLLLSRFSRAQLCATPETAAHQFPSSLGLSRQEHWSGLPFPSPTHESEKWKWSRSISLLWVFCLFILFLAAPCSLWLLVLWPGTGFRCLAVKVQSTNHWPTREFPDLYILKVHLIVNKLFLDKTIYKPRLSPGMDTFGKLSRLF